MRIPSDNNFVIGFSNVNGTGSASANQLVAKCIFRMGVTVAPKNLFPSNIQGMPTRFEIRVDEQGYTGSCSQVDVFIAMNRMSLIKDLQRLNSSGYLIYDSTIPLDHNLDLAESVNLLPIPITKLVRSKFADARQRGLLQNMVYVGVLLELLQLDRSILESVLKERYGQNKGLLQANYMALDIGVAYAREHQAFSLPFKVRMKDSFKDKVLVDGNSALALGAMVAGASVCSWYPITPSTSVIEAFSQLCKQYRQESDGGQKRYALIQAEDEIAACAMVLGAAWNGARSFTATSGPGISLMNELLGYAYYAEIPAVLFNIQRCGPSTGMPTKTQQADLIACAYASHGDTKHLMLLPSDPGECYEFAIKAFDLAEIYQTPLFVLSDLDIGMNEAMCQEFTLPKNYKPNRGKLLDEQALQKLEKPYFRYMDVDDDGIPYRSLPGTHAKGAYFTRGSGHDKRGQYTEDASLYMENVDRITKKFVEAAEALPTPEVQKHSLKNAGSRLALLCYGSTRAAAKEAIDLLRAKGIVMDMIRIKSFPFARSVKPLIESYDKIFIVEQNRDAQMRHLLLAESIASYERFTSILSYGGWPVEAQDLEGRITRSLEELSCIQ